LPSFLTVAGYQWETIDIQPVEFKGEFRSGMVDRYVLRCKHCGQIRTKLAW
jgi:uncharacterized protein CbrC (UPF0167 family)